MIICFACGWSIHQKNDGNFASCATRNDAVSRHFFPDGYFHPQTKKINSFLTGVLSIILLKI
jgi:hypothetical protein